MDGSAQTSRAGRVAALATLAVSATLFLTALLGIASIDPGGADAAAPVPNTPTRTVSIEDDVRDPDCPLREQRQRKRAEPGVTS
jgi:hypothetical protein